MLSEFTIFLSSLLYPNEYRKTLSAKSDKQKIATLTIIQKTLYQFSNNNLHLLLQKNSAFRHILEYSLSNQERVFFSSNGKQEKEEEGTFSQLSQPSKDKIKSVQSQQSPLKDAFNQVSIRKKQIGEELNFILNGNKNN